MIIELGVYAGSLLSVAAGAAAVGYKIARRISVKEATSIYETIQNARDKTSEKGTTISTDEAVLIFDETLEALITK